jgi:hypothetical protein
LGAPVIFQGCALRCGIAPRWGEDGGVTAQTDKVGPTYEFDPTSRSGADLAGGYDTAATFRQSASANLSAVAMWISPSPDKNRETTIGATPESAAI